ncbi:cytochrome P450 4C1-like [Neocloeon triangulifer]|uniref:cytochrome P450 4C1-like n=1 Tax=Neocloeon triangulifer TaxID=2078957 RepID=UPI00286ECEB7|nr:cytochrome P450 4C1-like [Neocloeon triangulifer]
MIEVILLVILFFSAWYLLTRTKHEVDKLPGPPAIPLFGNSLSFATSREESYKYMMQLTKTYYPVLRTWMGPTPVIHPLDPNIVEIILTSSQHITKSLEYAFISDWLGTGLLTSTGSKWHSRRKMLTPAFHFKILEQFVPVFGDNTAILVDVVKKKIKSTSGPINIVPLVTHCALDIICETAMGTAVHAQTDSESKYVSAMYEISDLIVHRMLRPWLHPAFIHDMTPTGRNFKRCLKTLRGFTNNVIQERKTEFRKNKASGKVKHGEDEFGVKKRTAFLDLLLEVSDEKRTLSDEDIREEVDTFMFEGHDTTAMAMSWALYFLGCNPDVQQKCVEELDEIFGGDDRKPTMNDLNQMKYLERVIKETLRLRPSVFMIGRQVTTDLKFGGYTFPKGTGIYMHIISIHLNPKVFPNPEKFDPDRFLPEVALGRHPYAYIPFSAGPRNCIGQKFAMLEQKTLLSTMLRNFKLRTVDPEKSSVYIPDLILRPKHGIDLEITLRQ